jgi:hypothetical protein
VAQKSPFEAGEGQWGGPDCGVPSEGGSGGGPQPMTAGDGRSAPAYTWWVWVTR